MPPWNAFWFREVPPHSYALLRILFGALGLISLFGLTPVATFWTPHGLMPVPGGGLGFKSQLIGLGLDGFVAWIFFAGLLAAFTCMTLGYRTSWAIPACFIGSALQSAWNPLPLSSAHHVLITVVFCLVWADCAHVWSLDARRRNGPDPAKLPQPEVIWPLRLIRFQIALIYVNSGFWKLFGEAWRDGSAVHYAVSLNGFHRFPSDMPASLEALATLGTYATLFWEITFPLLILNRWTRPLALLTGVALHTGMGVTLELGPFSAIMIASYVAFLEPATVEAVTSRWVERLSRRVARREPTREILS